MELYCSMGGGNVGATNIWAVRDPVPPRKPPKSALCYSQGVRGSDLTVSTEHALSSLGVRSA